MRHGAREIIEDATKAEAVMLNAQGVEQSRALGEGLLSSHPPAHLFHSTIGRCGQTAELLLEGMGVAAQGVKNHGGQRDLAAYYLPDNQHTYRYCQENGMSTLDFIQQWFAGELGAELAIPARRAAEQKLAFIQRCKAQWGGFQIHVSHDWNMMLLIAHYLELEADAAYWPGFLEGVLLTWEESGALTLRFREHEKRIDG
uniref:Phosphoglycerate mutase n=1 Tax=Magnetococcus massalia (strain MO-1) TaxID=451514 RepID=A0A1S7LDZ3_MAGMO|nr:Conserved protein of unknown function. putative phosphohistidine phosphatase, SixA [Candidatus Magnetococcus massalia]